MILLSQVDTGWLDSLGDFVNRVGFPVTVALSLGFGVWSVVRWLKPRGEELIAAHIVFTKQISETQQKLTATQSDTLRVLEEIKGMNHGSRRAIGHIGDAIVEIAPIDKQPAVRDRVQRAKDSLNDAE